MNDNHRPLRPASGPNATPAFNDPRRVRPMDWAVEAGATDEIWRQTGLKLRRRRQRLTALVGGLAALIIAGVFVVPSGDRGNTVDQVASSGPLSRGAIVLYPEKRTLPD